MPAIRDADLTVHITGSTALVSLGRGTVEVSGRKLNVSSGVFEIPDTHVKPAPSRTSLRIDGSMPAAAAFLATEGLRDQVGITLDPASTRGAVAATVTVNVPLQKEIPKGGATYSIVADLTNFSAEKVLMGQKLEAAALRIVAGPDGYQVKGDVKINGTPANIDLRKQKGDVDADLKMTATIDEAARLGGVQGEPTLIRPPKKHAPVLDLLVQGAAGQLGLLSRGEGGMSVDYQLGGW